MRRQRSGHNNRFDRSARRGVLMVGLAPFARPVNRAVMRYRGAKVAKKKLDAYKGRLSLEQIVAGINAAIHNARRLAEDARLLLESKRYPSAAALAILSIEESGKTSILRSLAFANNQEALIACWRNYRTHTKKNVSW